MRISLRLSAALAVAACVQALAIPGYAATTPQLSATPSSGPGGTTVSLIGTGFCPTPCSAVAIEFGGRPVKLGVEVGTDGAFRATFTVPGTALGGVNLIYASQTTATGQVQQANTRFAVTPSKPAPGTSTSPLRTSTPHTPTPATTSAGTPTPHPSTSVAHPGTPTETATTSSPSASQSTTVTPSSAASTSDGTAGTTPTEQTGKRSHGRLWALIVIVAALAAVGGALAVRRWRTRRTQ